MSVITLANPVRPDSKRYMSGGGNTIDVSMGKILRVIPLKEVAESTYYSDMAKLAKIFNHEIIETDSESRNWRWRPNLFTAWICDHAGVYAPSRAELDADTPKGKFPGNGKDSRASLNLNLLVGDLHEGMFTMEEWMKFYMQMGYSLSGYGEVFGQHEADEYGLPGAKKPKNRDSYTETVIDYMIRVHRGKVLKI